MRAAIFAALVPAPASEADRKRLEGLIETFSGYLSAVLRYTTGWGLFGDYHVQKVEAEVDTRNQASWTLLERLGFTRIAVRYAADQFKGGISDEYLYELTPS